MVIQGRQFMCYLKGLIRLPTDQAWPDLLLFLRYGELSAEKCTFSYPTFVQP